MAKATATQAKWVQAYSNENGWFRVDELQRRLETWVARMDEEPETEKGLAIVRREHEELLKKMADGFAKVFREAAWAVPGVLHQIARVSRGRSDHGRSGRLLLCRRHAL